ncbi:MAG: hypothetical protein FJY21_08945 [Bacteroidetes bacterium]|nr:hypothetical protein [Bacteroidota bacterium]
MKARTSFVFNLEPEYPVLPPSDCHGELDAPPRFPAHPIAFSIEPDPPPHAIAKHLSVFGIKAVLKDGKGWSQRTLSQD